MNCKVCGPMPPITQFAVYHGIELVTVASIVALSAVVMVLLWNGLLTPLFGWPRISLVTVIVVNAAFVFGRLAQP